MCGRGCIGGACVASEYVWQGGHFIAGGMCGRRDGHRGVLVFLKFGQFSSELTKTWSSGATECGV